MHGVHALANGGRAPDAEPVQGGALGTVKLASDDVMLGEPFTFERSDIDRFDF